MTQNDRIVAGQKLVEGIEPLREIVAIAGTIERDRIALSGASRECAKCGYRECADCIHYSIPKISLNSDYVIPLREEGVDEILSICSRVLQRRITSNIKKLEELVTSLKASEVETISADVAYKETSND